jgi:pimeloyl-ACP methyl ester carboxylesterase
MGRSIVTRMLVVAAALALLAGCGSGSPSSPSATSSPGTSPTPTTTPPVMPGPSVRVAGVRCGDPALGAQQLVTFPTTAGGTLAGYLLGSGSTVLILAAQAGTTSCDWLPYARAMAASGYSALAFDFSNEGDSTKSTSPLSADVAAAVRFARSRGLAKVVLIGASRGATAVLIAGATVSPPVTAVMSLSAPTSMGGEDALASVPKLTAPVLYLAAEQDTGFKIAARNLYDATPGSTRRLLVVPGYLHGEAFVFQTAEGSGEAVAAMEAFLTEHAPPR